MSRKTALVVAPGRGTYNKEELGYLKRHHAHHVELIAGFDAERRRMGQRPLHDLDGAERYSVNEFSRGDNASGLIHACAICDFLDIDTDQYEVVAITGNSMGWYLALACSGSLAQQDGFKLVNTMGTFMQDALIGGQMIYPFVDDAWREIPGKRTALLSLIEEVPGLYLSIELGGMLVLAGEESALAAAEARLEPIGGRFPMRLANHAAFHTPLQQPVSERGRGALPVELFGKPSWPLVDGRGHIWYPFETSVPDLWDYTLGHQVVQPYDFSAAVRHGVREFAPEAIILLGPGGTLGGAIAQVLIADEWRGLTSKTEFAERQSSDPILLSMGLADQRAKVVSRGKA
ncbi:MAG: ACP S-malonyltransferase [Pseudomonadota bacterium]